MALAGGGCSEDAAGPGVEPEPDAGPLSTETVEEALDALGVDTSATPRIDANGDPLPEDYSPLGSRPFGFKLDELLIAGAYLEGHEPTVNLFDGIAEHRNADGSLQSEFRFDPLEIGGTDWDSLDNVRVSARNVAAADIDGDGRDELVAVFQRTADDRLYVVVHGPEEEGFAPSDATSLSDEPFAGLGQIELAAADVDADGAFEIVAALTEPGTADTPSSVTLWVLDPADDGTLHVDDAWTLRVVAEEPDAQLSVGLAAGNLDDDNEDEVALVVNEIFRTTEGRARLFLIDSSANGPGTVVPQSVDVEAANDIWRVKIGDCAIGDVDGDGRPELLLGGAITVNNNCDDSPDMVVGAFHLTASGLEPSAHSNAYIPVTLQCNNPGPLRVRTVFLNALDADGDGDSEIAANDVIVDFDAEYDEWVEIGELSAAAFFPGETSAFRLDRSNTDVAVGDVTGDGRDDVST